MRYYKFTGNPDTYIWDEKPVVGEIYREDHYGSCKGKNYSPLNEKEANGLTALDFTPDWEEVDEDDMGIIVEYDPKPIPVRKFDWEAYREDFDEGDYIGYGTTKDEAIDNLLEHELLSL